MTEKLPGTSKVWAPPISAALQQHLSWPESNTVFGRDNAPAASREPAGRVVLVSMPFGPLFTPSIALGLVSSELRRKGFETRTRYFTISFAKRVGMRMYERISCGAPEGTLLLGDWLFRDALFGTAGADANDAYMSLFDEALRKRSFAARSTDSPWRTLQDVQPDLISIRATIDGFLEECTDVVLADNPMLVGFTTVFQQNVASLALSKRLKARSPGTRIVFGGANCESVMGRQMLASFPQLDHVISGEGEIAIVQLAEAISSGPRDGNALPTKECRDRDILEGSSAVDLDRLGYPEYDSYFEQVRAMPEAEGRARLLFETSRGCWWGERSHCTFCGLNGTSMAFRSKAATRAYDELEWLTSRHPDHAVSVVDNILDLKYFDSFVPMLQKNPVGADLFYEVKANLRKDQLRQLSAANITLIQPEIESLHDDVLRIMRKGVSAIQNVQLLKWCAELGIKALWNFIWGFPRERPEWYSEMAGLLPLIPHLQPPDGGSDIRLDRFSPLFKDSQLGAVNVKPFPAYGSVYAELSEEERFNLAYHFTFERCDERDAREYAGEVRDAISRWNEIHDRSAYFFIPIDDQILLCDLRDPEAVALKLLDPFETRLYRMCDGAKTVDTVHRKLADSAVTRVACTERLQSLAANDTMMESKGRYLSLAIEMNAHVPGVSALQRFQAFLQKSDISADSSIIRVPLSAMKSSGQGAPETGAPASSEAAVR